MVTEEKEIRNLLNDLIETCKDGEKGFQSAAEKAKESSLKSLFTKYASQRAQYGGELQTLVTEMGGDAATSGHVSASLHRGWMNLKEALAKNEDKALIDECEAGEDAAVKNYREVRSKGLPADLATILQRQSAGVEEAHRTLSNLKHGRATMAASRL